MAITPLEINFPLKGVSENVSFTDQPPMTSRDAQNVVAVDPITGRARGAQRAGFSKYVSTQPNGSNNVVDLGVVVGDDSQLTYAELTEGNVETVWRLIAPTADSSDPSRVVHDAEMGPAGDIYCLCGDAGFFVINPDGKVAEKSVTTVPVVSGALRRIAVDDSYNVYVGVGADKFGGGGDQGDARIWKYRLKYDGTYELDWEIDPVQETGTFTITSYCTAITTHGNSLFVGLHDHTNGEGEVQRYDGIDSATTPDVALSFSVDPGPMGIRIKANNEIVVCTHGSNHTGANEQQLAKYDSGGAVIWRVGSNVTVTAGADIDIADSEGGMGRAIELTSSGNVYSFGPTHTGGTMEKLHLWIDEGTTVSEAWAVFDSDASYDNYPFNRIAVDENDSVYTPWPGTSALGGTPAIQIYDSGGNELLAVYDQDVGSGHSTQCVLLPPAFPDYGSDAVEHAEFVYGFGAWESANVAGGAAISSSTNAKPIVVTTSAAHGFVVGDEVIVVGHTGNESANGRHTLSAVGSTTTATLKNTAGVGVGNGEGRLGSAWTGHKLRVVSASVASGSQRTQKVLAVAGGTIAYEDSGSWTTPTGGSGALDSSSEFTSSVDLFGERFYTDGITYAVYSLADDEVTTYLAEKGSLEPRCKLFSAWRGRLVGARPADDGRGWFMSAVGNPYDFDYFPLETNPLTAVSGVNSALGRVEDIINGLCPWSDNLLFFFGDHTIWRLTGDPRRGGQIHNVSRKIGGAFGNCWTRDPNGIIYFYSTEGGIYALPPTSLPERISSNWIERRLQDVDLSTRHARLAWNFRREGLDIYLPARGSGGAAQEHYFWEQKTGGWQPKSFSNVDHEPSSVVVLDGDAPGDRLTLVGCEDGYVRKEDEGQKDDDGTAIDSYVTIGPLTRSEVGRAVRVVSLQVNLAGDQGGCHWELFATDTPDVLGNPVAQGRLTPGRNPAIYDARVTAAYFYLRLRNFEVGSHWSFESGLLRVAPDVQRLRVGMNPS